MKYPSLAAVLCLTAFSLQAEIVNFRISPPGTSAAVGLSPANENPPVTNSGGSGDEVFSGITFDTELMILDFSIGYGSFAGFTDLTGEAVAAHIHGPAAATENNSVVYDFVANMQHLPAPDPLLGGLIVGSLVLANEQEVADLMNGLYYINIHTTNNPAGELRGQLVPVFDVPPTVVCPDPAEVECASRRGTRILLTASVEDANGDPLTVKWIIDGEVYQTDEVPSGGETTMAEVTLDGLFGHGDHVVGVTVTDGNSDPVGCRTRVRVVDTTAPVVERLVARPSLIWPPNHKMVPVRLRIKTEDDCGPVTNRIVTVESNEPINGTGDGNTAPDWRVTDDLRLFLRAERSGHGSGRVYTVTVESTDVGGNVTHSTVDIVVPHDKGKKKGKKNKYEEREDDDDQGKGKGKKNKRNKGKGKSGR